MENKQEEQSKPTYSSESKKQEEKGSNYTPPSMLKTKRHAIREDGTYCQAIWNQQFNSLCRLWGREEKQKAKSGKSNKRKERGEQ